MLCVNKVFNGTIQQYSWVVPLKTGTRGKGKGNTWKSIFVKEGTWYWWEAVNLIYIKRSEGILLQTEMDRLKSFEVYKRKSLITDKFTNWKVCWKVIRLNRSGIKVKCWQSDKWQNWQTKTLTNWQTDLLTRKKHENHTENKHVRSCQLEKMSNQVEKLRIWPRDKLTTTLKIVGDWQLENMRSWLMPTS